MRKGFVVFSRRIWRRCAGSNSLEAGAGWTESGVYLAGSTVGGRTGFDGEQLSRGQRVVVRRHVNQAETNTCQH